MPQPVEFPVALHVRCTPEMLAEFKARGGGRWLRALITANTRPPVETLHAELPPIKAIRSPRATPDGKRVTHTIGSGTRATKKGAPGAQSRRVPLDKKKRRRV